MFKRSVLLLLTLVLFMLPSMAQTPDGPQSLADSVPGDAVLFAGLRIEEAYLDQLDTLAATVAERLDQTDMVPPLRDALEGAMASSGMDLSLDEIFAWSGEYAALTLLDENGDQFLLHVEASDPAAATTFLEANLEPGFETSTEGDFTVYRQITGEMIAIGNEFIVAGMDSDVEAVIGGVDFSLADNEEFARLSGDLTADVYNIFVYADLGAFSDTASGTLGAPTPEISGGFVAAFTILNGNSLTMDLAFGDIFAMGDVRGVNPDFLRFVPADANAVIHSRDFSRLLEIALDFIDSQSPPDQPGIRDSLQMMLGDIDLEQDVLSWTDGDFALFARTDTFALVGAVMANQLDLNGLIDLGIIFEATDPVAAQGLVEKLTKTIQSFGLPGVTVTPGELKDTPAIDIQIALPLAPGQNVTLDLSMGVNDDIFYIATANIPPTFLTRETKLPGNPLYMDASRYFLSNPTSVWYTDGEGFVTTVGGTTVGVLALLGPVIGNIFEDIIEQLEAAAPVRAQVIQQEDPFTQLLQGAGAAIDLVESTSITTAVAGSGTALVRLVLTYQN